MKNSLAKVVQLSEEPLEITRSIVQACNEVKGKEPVVLKVNPGSDVADYFVIVSARSDRQVEGIATKVYEVLGLEGCKPNSVEGLDKSHWVVMDYGDVVLHIFYEPLRSHYNLEGLWYKAERVVV